MKNWQISQGTLSLLKWINGNWEDIHLCLREEICPNLICHKAELETTFELKLEIEWKGLKKTKLGTNLVACIPVVYKPLINLAVLIIFLVCHAKMYKSQQ